MFHSMRKDGVSPVIAVILMVAITIIIAGVAYLFILTIIDTDDEGPATSYFNVRLVPDDDTIYILVTRGDTFDSANHTINIGSITIDLPDDLILKVGESTTIDVSGQIDLIREMKYLVTITSMDRGEVVYAKDIVAR